MEDPDTANRSSNTNIFKYFWCPIPDGDHVPYDEHIDADQSYCTRRGASLDTFTNQTSLRAWDLIPPSTTAANDVAQERKRQMMAAAGGVHNSLARVSTENVRDVKDRRRNLDAQQQAEMQLLSDSEEDSDESGSEEENEVLA